MSVLKTRGPTKFIIESSIGVCIKTMLSMSKFESSVALMISPILVGTSKSYSRKINGFISVIVK